MFIRAYVRTLTKHQDVDRAKNILKQFADERDQKIASYYIENASGTNLNRIELKRLLNDGQPNDILLVEKIDRLTRLNNDDWIQLKKHIESLHIRIVSLDIPTSWQALGKNITHNAPITKDVLDAINNMLIDIKLHQKVISLRKQGRTLEKISEVTGYCHSDICKILATYKEKNLLANF